MFRRSTWARWVPNYFRGQHSHQRQLRAVSRRPSRVRSAPEAGGGTSSTNANSVRQQQQHEMRVPSHHVHSGRLEHHLHPELSPAGINPLAANLRLAAPQRERLQPLCQQAQQMVKAWRAARDGMTVAGTSVEGRGSEAHLRFTALTDVLGPLASMLPPPPPHMQNTSSAGSENGTSSSSVPSLRVKGFRVVPDHEATVVGNPELPSPPAAAAPVTALSLEELVSCLELYDLASCENGELLLQLIGEVHRFVFGNLPLATAAATTSDADPNSSSHTKSGRRPAPLPFPQLLLVLSQLGLTEERLLQAIVQRPSGPRLAGDPGAGLLYRDLPTYSVAELVSLLVALHRFGLQQDFAFQSTTKALSRHHIFRPHSVAWNFNKRMATLAKQWSEEAAQQELSSEDRLTHQPLTKEEVGTLLRTQDQGASPNASTHEERTVFDELPQLPPSLQCPPSLLVEALTAVSLSVFRRRGTVAFLSNLLIASVVAELRAVLESEIHSEEEKGVTVTALSHVLLRGVRLCEEMNDPQVLLANCLAFSIDVGKRGVVTDGGEDADVPSERRAYYDQVTADLVKVNRV